MWLTHETLFTPFHFPGLFQGFSASETQQFNESIKPSPAAGELAQHTAAAQTLAPRTHIR